MRNSRSSVKRPPPKLDDDEEDGKLTKPPVSKRMSNIEDDQTFSISLARDNSKRDRLERENMKRGGFGFGKGGKRKKDDIIAGQLNVMNKKSFEKVALYRRFMLASTVLCLICSICFIIAVATTGIWGEYKEETKWYGDSYTNQSGFTCVWSHIGHAFIIVRWLPHFPNPPRDIIHLAEAGDLPHFYRTQAGFSVIALLMMIGANCCAVYSLHRHRYMFKRLTAALLAFSAICVLIVIEVMIHSIFEWEKELDEKRVFQDGIAIKKIKYSYSTIISWVVFGMYLFSGAIYLIGSGKQKGDLAAATEFEQEDRPVIIR